jgi:hypothetical protein
MATTDAGLVCGGVTADRGIRGRATGRRTDRAHAGNRWQPADYVDGRPGGAGADPIDAATERLIDRTLVIREVDRYAVPEPADAEVEARVARLMSAFPSQEAFRDTLASVAFTEAQLRAWARNDLRIEAYLDQRFASAETPERRADLVRDWIADLRRRTPVVDLRK